MATSQERIAVVEVKVNNIEHKITQVEVNIDQVKENIELTKTDLLGKLDTMYQASCSQHSELAKKLDALEGVKNRWTYTALGAVAALSFIFGHWDKVSKLFT